MTSEQGKVCFAYSDRKCHALKEMQCEGCKFFKTREQLEDEQRRTRKRLKALNYGYIGTIVL